MSNRVGSETAAASEQFDVIVVGSGAAGLSAAVVAARHRLRVLVLEKADVVGGTTARSGGWLWVPCNALEQQAGMPDSVDEARTYLRHETGEHFDARRVDAYLEHGPEMVDWFTANTALQFELGPTFADYHCDAPGGKPGGRSIVAAPFDGRELGEHIRHLGRPLPELTLLGLMIGSGEELWHFFNATRSPRSMWHVMKLCARYARDRLFHRRAMRLTNGNALAGRLFRSAIDAGVQFRLGSQVTGLVHDDNAGLSSVRGVTVRSGSGEVVLSASRGVILAAGGFPHDIARRAELFGHAPTGHEHVSPAPESNTGDGLRLGESVGARVTSELPHAAAWVPVSRVPRADGSVGVFPHFVDRSKPGVIAVNRHGERFVNEADSYHDFIQGLVASYKNQSSAADSNTDNPAGEQSEICAWFVADHRTVRRYGLGFAKASPLPVGPYVRSGYLLRANTLAGLAQQAGFDANRFEQTVARFNEGAANGTDSQFGRGTTAYNRSLGDPSHQPNPCVAPIVTGPFYAVKVVPGDLGTFAGLQTDQHARVLDAQTGAPIQGLYACGNDAGSIMGGNYPGGGITLGPAVTFGYIAARHLAGAGQGNAPGGQSGRSADQAAADRAGAAALVSAFEMRRSDVSG